MSILAEPRRKQRISVDPQNLQWRDDDNKVSKKMMEKMGWKDGKGLGRNAHGNVDAVKLKANHSGKGLGADKMASYDSTWIGHHDDFADLLAALNKNKPKEEETEEEKKERTDKISIELSSKSVKRRIHYQKFTRMKDTANYSEQDKSAVLGVGLKRTKEESPEAKKENSEVDQGNTTVSTLSVGDYFAQKMAALKAKSTSVSSGVKKEEVEDDEEYGKTVVDQSFNSFAFSYDEEPIKKEVDDDEAYGRSSFNQNFSFSYESQEVKVKIEEKVEDEEEARRRRKAEKKLRRQQKKAEEAVKVEPVEEEKAEEEMTEKQRRKMEKRLRKQMERELNDETVAEEETVEEEPPKKKKKKRCDVEEETTESEKPKKKKKNKD